MNYNKKSNWVVFAVNDARRFTHGGYNVESHPTGLYIQPQLAKEFLIEFKIMNYDILKNAIIDYTENDEKSDKYTYGNKYSSGCSCSCINTITIEEAGEATLLVEGYRKKIIDRFKKFTIQKKRRL